MFEVKLVENFTILDIKIELKRFSSFNCRHKKDQMKCCRSINHKKQRKMGSTNALQKIILRFYSSIEKCQLYAHDQIKQ